MKYFFTYEGTHCSLSAYLCTVFRKKSFFCILCGQERTEADNTPFGNVYYKANYTYPSAPQETSKSSSLTSPETDDGYHLT